MTPALHCTFIDPCWSGVLLLLRTHPSFNLWDWENKHWFLPFFYTTSHQVSQLKILQHNWSIYIYISWSNLGLVHVTPWAPRWHCSRWSASEVVFVSLRDSKDSLVPQFSNKQITHLGYFNFNQYVYICTTTYTYICKSIVYILYYISPFGCTLEEKHRTCGKGLDLWALDSNLQFQLRPCGSMLQ